MTQTSQLPLVVFSHGKETGPWGTKIRRLADVAQAAGWQVLSIDYAALTRQADALAEDRLAALHALAANNGVLTVNLGTGIGYSVLDLVSAFEVASGKKVPYKIVARRAGDIAVCYADPSAAKKILGWQAKLDVNAMCRDVWRWQSNNPSGYQ